MYKYNLVRLYTKMEFLFLPQKSVMKMLKNTIFMKEIYKIKILIM